jgi:hypothetical protein
MSKDDEIPKHRSYKNTRRWCKGKVGVEHKPIWIDKSKYDIHYSYEYSCQVCQKILNSYHEWRDSSSLYQYSKPEYERPIIGSIEPLKKKDKE